MTIDEMRGRWRRLALKLGLAGAVDDAFDDLRRRYTQPGRVYHNLDHVSACLHALDEATEHAERPEAIEAALWFHDAVYVPGDRENERRSAALAVETLTALRAPADVPQLVYALVMATAHRTTSNVPDERLIADIDLVILATPEERYRRYRAAIAEEAGLPADEFARRRVRFLQAMLSKPTIFQTGLFRDRHEEAARQNMSAEATLLLCGLLGK